MSLLLEISLIVENNKQTESAGVVLHNNMEWGEVRIGMGLSTEFKSKRIFIHLFLLSTRRQP